MDKKYILTDTAKRVNGKWVRQIQAVRDFSVVRKGELGGFIHDESNLSHDGYCWVYADGVVADNARVIEDAQVYRGIVCDSATVKGCAKIGRPYDEKTFSQVCGNASIEDKAVVYDNAIVSGFAVLKDYARVTDYARVDDNVVMEGCANAFHYAFLFGNAHLKDNAFVCGHCKVGGDVTLIDHCCVTDDSIVVGNQELSSYENKKYKLLKTDTIEVD
jgi:NDP-sugar pyrophosphorylase family protein